MRESATPHADAFSTWSLSTQLVIAFVPAAAGLLTMPSWCRLSRKALAPSAPPRCTRHGHLVAHNPKRCPSQGCGQVTHSARFRHQATGSALMFCRLSNAMSPKLASVVRSRYVVTGTTVFAAANAQMDTTRYLAAARGAAQTLPQLFSSFCLYCPGCCLSHSSNGKP